MARSTQGSSALLGAYPTRILLSLASSIALVILCFHLPLDVPLNVVGWQFSRHAQQPLLDITEVTPEKAQDPSGAPITLFDQQEEETIQGEDVEQRFEEESLPAPETPQMEKLKVLQVLDRAEEAPSIKGGVGAYYIHIQYPEEAIAQNIQGRLVLSFVVEPDGRASDIQVLKSLHPLCDSSAVAALRRTHFVPGRQNGEAVRVRMRLPVKFTILDPPSSLAESDSTTSEL